MRGPRLSSVARNVLLHVLQCGMLLVMLSSSSGTHHHVAVNAADTSYQDRMSADKCWIFTHLQKSGGSTVKGMLRETWCPKCGIYDSRHWKKGDNMLEAIGEVIANGEEWNVIAGGYTEALRRSDSVGEQCQWFTVFRHPIPRMVSAYYYCKQNYKDQLCASKFLSADHVDLETFAKHWGNFAMRQFALNLVSADDVVRFSKTDTFQERLPPVSNKKVGNVPGWYLLKMYLDDQSWTTSGVGEYTPNHDAALYEMLQPVQNLLRDKYTAVGILEEFNTTLSLFDAALEMPGVHWHNLFKSKGQVRVGADMYAQEKAETLAEAWTSSEIKKYMALDIMLYDHAVAVFGQQTRAYGIV